MQQVPMKVSEEDYEGVVEYQNESDCSKSEAGRMLVSRGLKYTGLKAENERLDQDLQSLKSENEELRTEIYDLNEKRNRFIEDIVLTMLENIGGSE